MDTDKGLEVPTETFQDGAQKLAKIGLSPIPGASELFGAIFTAPIEIRRQEWMQKVVSAIQELQRQSLTTKDLQESDKFIDLVLSANKVAATTSQKEKLDFLQSAIVNFTLNEDINIDEQAVYISMIESLSAAHILIMSYFWKSKTKWIQTDYDPRIPNKSLALKNRFGAQLKKETLLQSISDVGLVVSDCIDRGLLDIVLGDKPLGEIEFYKLQLSDKARSLVVSTLDTPGTQQ